MDQFDELRNVLLDLREVRVGNFEEELDADFELGSGLLGEDATDDWHRDLLNEAGEIVVPKDVGREQEN
jgi:hypothetical protein